MREWLPWAMLVVLALLIGAAPWHKVDPKHEFVVSMLRNMSGEDIH